MSDAIAPALTPEEWVRSARHTDHFIEESAGVGDWGAIIAAANAALPDSDPRKITWRMVDDLRYSASVLGGEFGADDDDALRTAAIADALASYLAPRK